MVRKLAVLAILLILVPSIVYSQVPWNRRTATVTQYRLTSGVTNDPKLAKNMGTLAGADSLGWSLGGTYDKFSISAYMAGAADSMYVVLKYASTEVGRYYFVGGISGMPKYIWGPRADAIYVIRATPSGQLGFVHVYSTD